MDEPDLIRLFADPLHRSGFRYLVAGSMGAMLYGEPRLTMDIDFAVALPEEQLRRLPEIFREPDYYCPDLEVLHQENRREAKAHFNVIHVWSGLKADFYPSQRDPFFAWAWEERQVMEYYQSPIHYAPPEYVIVWKVAYFAEGGGEKHIRDIRRMLEVSGWEIRLPILEEELRRRKLWETYLRMVGEELP